MILCWLPPIDVARILRNDRAVKLMLAFNSASRCTTEEVVTGINRLASANLVTLQANQPPSAVGVESCIAQTKVSVIPEK